MVDTITLILAGVLAYTVGAMALRRAGKIPNAVNVNGPLTTVHTKRGRVLLERLAAPKRFWRAWANIGVGAALVFMVGLFVTVLGTGFRSASEPSTTTIQNPQNVLVIPGVNEFLPLSAAPDIVFGLLIGLVVHEGGHGLLCRVEDIDIDSMGLVFLAFIPIGAFVEPDEESRANASRGGQLRMFAAGVTNNFALSLFAMVLLFGPIAGSIAVVPGVPVGDVVPGTAAASSNLDRGDVITGVEGVTVENKSELDRVLANDDSRNVSVQLRSGESIQLERHVVVTRAVPFVLSGINLSGGEPPKVLSVNGTAVATEREFHRAVENRTIARIETNKGTTTIPVGSFITQIIEDGPLAEAGAPTDGRSFNVTHIGGDRVPNSTALDRVLDEYEPGESVAVVTYSRGERHTYQVELGENNGDAYLGVRPLPGTTGLTVNGLGIEPYPAGQFLGSLGGGKGFLGGLTSGNFFIHMYLLLVLPVRSLALSGAFNFAGFTGGVANFYQATGPLSFLGGGIFLAANLAFWTAWINFQIALFNAIPTFPLDGGHILRTSAESVTARLPIENKRRLTTAIAASISIAMIASLFFMLFGPALLT